MKLRVNVTVLSAYAMLTRAQVCDLAQHLQHTTSNLHIHTTGVRANHTNTASYTNQSLKTHFMSSQRLWRFYINAYACDTIFFAYIRQRGSSVFRKLYVVLKKKNLCNKNAEISSREIKRSYANLSRYQLSTINKAYHDRYDCQPSSKIHHYYSTLF